MRRVIRHASTGFSVAKRDGSWGKLPDLGLFRAGVQAQLNKLNYSKTQPSDKPSNLEVVKAAEPVDSNTTAIPEGVNKQPNFSKIAPMSAKDILLKASAAKEFFSSHPLIAGDNVFTRWVKATVPGSLRGMVFNALLRTGLLPILFKYICLSLVVGLLAYVAIAVCIKMAVRGFVHVATNLADVVDQLLQKTLGMASEYLKKQIQYGLSGSTFWKIAPPRYEFDDWRHHRGDTVERLSGIELSLPFDPSASVKL